MNAESVIQLSESDLEQRKNSISKQTLIDALIRVKEIRRLESMHNAESVSDNVVKLITNKIDCLLSPILQKLESTVAKCDRLSQLFDNLKTEHDDLKMKVTSQTDSMFSEISDRLSRRQNLIFHGVAESPDGGSISQRKSHDLDQLQKIAGLLDVDDFSPESFRRVGKPNKNGSRALVVRCHSVEDKWAILRKSKQLRAHDLTKHVFVNHDLTKTQQLQDKTLRSELNIKNKNGNNFMIRSGKIVPRTSNHQQYFR